MLTKRIGSERNVARTEVLVGVLIARLLALVAESTSAIPGFAPAIGGTGGSIFAAPAAKQRQVENEHLGPVPLQSRFPVIPECVWSLP